MVIGTALIELDIPASASLKDKRRVVRSVIARLRRDYNFSVAEVDALDQWQRAVIGISAVSNDARYTHGLLEKAIAALAEWRLDCVIAGYQIEIW
ncbi:MAG TPA: DUF503 domain-containing protein [Caldilineae bacterium]|nr:DUF503 domain-containing protein [Caldilineae bacterium]